MFSFYFLQLAASIQWLLLFIFYVFARSDYCYFCGDCFALQNVLIGRTVVSVLCVCVLARLFVWLWSVTPCVIFPYYSICGAATAAVAAARTKKSINYYESDLSERIFSVFFLDDSVLFLLSNVWYALKVWPWTLFVRVCVLCTVMWLQGNIWLNASTKSMWF